MSLEAPPCPWLRSDREVLGGRKSKRGDRRLWVAALLKLNVDSGTHTITSELHNWLAWSDNPEPDFNVEFEDMSLKTLQHQNPPAYNTDSPNLAPLEHKDTPREAIKAATQSTVNSYILTL